MHAIQGIAWGVRASNELVKAHVTLHLPGLFVNILCSYSKLTTMTNHLRVCRKLVLPPTSVRLHPPESWSSMARNFLRAAQVCLWLNRTLQLL